MNVGFVGLGKLGLPCALAMERYGGHTVRGCDASPAVLDIVRSRRIPYLEAGAQELLERSRIELCSPREIVARSDLIFFAVQTPHEARFEGTGRLPPDRADFDYGFLRGAVEAYASEALEQRREAVFAVISTVLPGTIDREIRPLLNPYARVCYNPFFIAMGTAIEDLMAPEYVLLGTDDPGVGEFMGSFYRTLHAAPIVVTSVASAELVKVSYNTFIGLKIVFANALMEISHATGANVDDVTQALALADKRLISAKYLKAGMGDGGGCHPRDNIAMSYLARKLGLSYDLFESLMLCRESQTQWLADMAARRSRDLGLPVVILGEAFKPETNLTVGSPALLLKAMILERGILPSVYDPHTCASNPPPEVPAVFVVATRHAAFASYAFPPGSDVLDPWGYVADQEGVEVVRIGRAEPKARQETAPERAR